MVSVVFSFSFDLKAPENLSDLPNDTSEKQSKTNHACWFFLGANTGFSHLALSSSVCKEFYCSHTPSQAQS